MSFGSSESTFGFAIEDEVENDKELPEKGVEYEVLALHGVELDAIANALGRSNDVEMLELNPRTNVRETAILLVMVKKKVEVIFLSCPPPPQDYRPGFSISI